MSSKDIEGIKKAAGEYAKEALEARSMFLSLRLRQDPEVRKIFVRAADRIASEIAKGGVTPLRKKMLAQILEQLELEAGIIRDDLTGKIDDYLLRGAEAGSWFSKEVTVKLFEQARIPKVEIAKVKGLYNQVNREAVVAIQNRTVGGLKLSDRIWKTAQNSREAMKNIIQDAVASGQDAVTTARMLQQYVKKGALTLAKDYPELVKTMAGRIPQDLSYEALRLARTEMTAAFGQAQIRAAQESPSAKGIKYCLSSSHHIRDICDELANQDEAGLGPGVYPVNDPPPYPAHPNTMSYLVTVNESPEDFVRRLKRWQQEPDSDPALEDWYRDKYQAG